MDKKLAKKKTDLMKSILGNTKLAKSFREAMGSPIGSTKRDQAKTMFSIMKKLGGVSYDGKGGPGVEPTYQNQSIPKPVDYSNMVIFPAAPKFKTQNKQTPSVNDGQGGPFDSLFSQPYTSTPGTGKLTAPTGPVPGGAFIKSTWEAITNPKPLTPRPPTPLFGGALSNYQSPLIIGAAEKLNVPQVTWPTLGGKKPEVPATPSRPATQTDVDSLMQSIAAAKGKSQSETSPVTGGAPVVQTDGSPSTTRDETPTYTQTPTPAPTPGSAEDITSRAQQSVAEGTGAGLFAKGITDEKFGGSLEQYINNLDQKLKTDFNLDNLETELSNLKAQKQNLIPTLTQYVNGKDQYLKSINQMIENTEKELMKTDISDPREAAAYTNHLNYLYTLQGRQTQRYGNFLESAVADYNADLERTESNYTNVFNRYNTAITRQSGIAQNEYNTLYQTMADLYTSLDEAPTKRLNLEILQQQKTLNNIKIIEAAEGNNSSTLDYGKVQEYAKSIADKDGNLSPEALGADGLAGHLMAAGDKNAMIKAINTAMATSLSPKEGGAGETDRVSQAFKFKKLIDDLASVPGGETYAAKMYPTFNQNANDLVSNYVLGNIDSIKSATKDLVTESKPWFSKNKKPGLEDKETWKESYSDLDSNLLDSLYNLTNNIFAADDSYKSNPDKYLTDLLSGTKDEDTAKNITAVLLSGIGS